MKNKHAGSSFDDWLKENNIDLGEIMTIYEQIGELVVQQDALIKEFQELNKVKQEKMDNFRESLNIEGEADEFKKQGAAISEKITELISKLEDGDE